MVNIHTYRSTYRRERRRRRRREKHSRAARPPTAVTASRSPVQLIIRICMPFPLPKSLSRSLFYLCFWSTFSILIFPTRLTQNTRLELELFVLHVIPT